MSFVVDKKLNLEKLVSYLRKKFKNPGLIGLEMRYKNLYAYCFYKEKNKKIDEFIREGLYRKGILVAYLYTKDPIKIYEELKSIYEIIHILGDMGV